MGFSCIDLLPQSPKTQLPTHLSFCKTLKLLRFVTTQAIEALESFYFKKHYHEFDPHVGDTACQIHAYKLLLLSLKPVDEKINEKISRLKIIAEKILHDLTFYSPIEKTSKGRSLPHTILKRFIEENHYNYELDDDELFIVISRILTVFKRFISGRKFIIDYEKISEFLEISREGATRFAIFYQRKISKISCAFILTIASQAPYSPVPLDVTKNLMLEDDNARKVLPCYITMKVILAHIHLNKIGIIVIIKRTINNNIIDTFSLNYGYYPSEPHAYYIIEGTSESHANETRDAFLKRFLQYSIDEIILLNEAAHPQYCGKKLEHLKINPFTFSLLTETVPENLYKPLESELLMLRNRAIQEGCSLENNTLFCIDHIFCGNIQESFATLPRVTTMEQQ